MLFVTGTDTDVGKTVLTGLLLCHLRSRGVDARALKPFCSGGTGDLRILATLHGKALALDEMSPFRFRAPLAPAIAARLEGRTVLLRDAVASVNRLRRRCELLLVEGCGGLYVPLGRRFTVADLMRRVAHAVIVVGRNRLGVVNHTLLTVRAIEAMGLRRVSIALMGEARADASARTNRQTLAEWTGCYVGEIPFLGAEASDPESLVAHERKIKKTLARLIGSANVAALLATAASRRKTRLDSGGRRTRFPEAI